MNYEIVTLKEKIAVGISARTNNTSPDAGVAIGGLWNRFYNEGVYESIPWLSRFWMYFPVPLAGIAMIVFELEAVYNHIKSFFIPDGEVQK